MSGLKPQMAAGPCWAGSVGGGLASQPHPSQTTKDPSDQPQAGGQPLGDQTVGATTPGQPAPHPSSLTPAVPKSPPSFRGRAA